MKIHRCGLMQGLTYCGKLTRQVQVAVMTDAGVTCRTCRAAIERKAKASKKGPAK